MRPQRRGHFAAVERGLAHFARALESCSHIWQAAEDERSALLERLRAKAGEQHWPTIQAGIARSMEEIRKRGYCVNIGDWRPHANSVAMPFRLRHPEQTLLASNIDAPSYELSSDARASAVLEQASCHQGQA